MGKHGYSPGLNDGHPARTSMSVPVVIIGAGPAGLLAAYGARETKCLVLEKMPRPGIKLSLTGNGRGNLTNLAPVKKMQEAFFEHGDFLRPALQNLSPKKLLALFSNLGLATVQEDKNRVFPVSGRARDIVDCLVGALKKEHIEIICVQAVTKICRENGSISGIECNQGEKNTFLAARAVILACGGASWPQTGSTGDGYALARELGHSVTPCLPALSPLSTDAPIQLLQGLSLTAVKASLVVNDRAVISEQGDVIFTHFGLSGPAILDISRVAAKALTEKQKTTLLLDLFPDQNSSQLDNLLQSRAAQHGKKQMLSLLSGLLPARLAEYVLLRAQVEPTLQAARLSTAKRKTITNQLKNMPFTITGTPGFKRAMLTRGGVNLEEVDPHTLESRLVRGLFFAGEILDLDGKSGGYNLHAAFATGFLAGQHAARNTG